MSNPRVSNLYEVVFLRSMYFKSIFAHIIYHVILYAVIPVALRNDIALIHISPADTPVSFTDYIQPICLATPQFDVKRDAVECYASGWGDIRGFGKWLTGRP